MTTEPLDPVLARLAWAALQQEGGLVSVADLREQWGRPGEPLSRSRVYALIKHESIPFPNPVVDQERGSLWLAAEVDAWLRAYNARPGKPGPRATGTRGATHQGPKQQEQTPMHRTQHDPAGNEPKEEDHV